MNLWDTTPGPKLVRGGEKENPKTHPHKPGMGHPTSPVAWVRTTRRQFAEGFAGGPGASWVFTTDLGLFSGSERAGSAFPAGTG